MTISADVRVPVVSKIGTSGDISRIISMRVRVAKASPTLAAWIQTGRAGQAGRADIPYRSDNRAGSSLPARARARKYAGTNGAIKKTKKRYKINPMGMSITGFKQLYQRGMNTKKGPFWL